MSIQEGTVLSGCRIVERIGQGGMATVYKAIDEALHRRVAIKVLLSSLSDPESRKRFLREAGALAQCDHPGIARIYTYGEYEGEPYFVMELLRGRSLEWCLSRARSLHSGAGDPVPPATDAGPPVSLTDFFLTGLPQPLTSSTYIGAASSLVASLSDSLSHAHQLGIIHRDIKPSNIYVCDSGLFKLLDFGLARSPSSEPITTHPALLGTLLYMAPEQVSAEVGNISPRTDIYTLGVVYYELCTLVHPVMSEELPGLIQEIMRGDPVDPRTLNPGLPPEICEIIRRCMAKEPENRFASAADLADAIRMNIISGASCREEPLDPDPLGDTLAPGRPEMRASSPSARRPGAPGISPPVTVAATRGETSPALGAEAEKLYRKAYRDVHTRLDPEDALDTLTYALELCPDHFEAQLLYAQALMQTGEHQKGRDILASLQVRATPLDERERLLLDLAIAYLFEREWKRAYPLATKYRADFGFHPLAHGAIAYWLDLEGRTAEGLARDREDLRSHPDHTRLSLNIAFGYRKLGDCEASLAILEEKLTEQPDLTTLRRVAAWIRLELGDLSGAEAHLADAVEREPTNAPALSLLAEIRAWHGDYEGAAQLTRRCIGVCRNDASRSETYLQLSKLSRHQDRSAEADRYLEIAQRLAPAGCPHSSQEDIRQALQDTPLSGLFPAGVPVPDQDILTSRSRELCLRSTDVGALMATGRLNYYRIDPSGALLHLFIAPYYNQGPTEMKTAVFALPAIPVLPFVDESGNILRVEYKDQTASRFGKYLGIVRVEPPRSPGQACFISAGLDTVALAEDHNGGVHFRTHEMTVPSCKIHALLLSVPNALQLQWLSRDPDRTTRFEDHVLYTFDDMLFVNQSYPQVEMILSPS